VPRLVQKATTGSTAGQIRHDEEDNRAPTGARFQIRKLSAYLFVVELNIQFDTALAIWCAFYDVRVGGVLLYSLSGA
jgi:hypothetical protein